MDQTIKLDSIAEAIDDFRQGKMVIVVDDEDRENEGDIIVAAEKITPEQVNFMLKNARGVLCAPITISRCRELDLPHQVDANTSMLGTPFTVTVDKLEGCTTGVSAADRCATIRALADPASTPDTFGRPGHINPLYAQDQGVLRRSGHTEAAVDLARLAGLQPAAALMEIMTDDGDMARLPELRRMADRWGMKLVSIRDLIAYRLESEQLVEQGVEVDMPTAYGHFRLIPFRQKSNGLEHIAIIKGDVSTGDPVLVRVHSSCATGDIFGSLRCDCGEQLRKALQMIETEGRGAVVYLNQEGRGIGLMDKIRAYKLQEEGLDTVEANLHLGHDADERDYGVGAQILNRLGISKMKLMTNNPIKRVGLEGYGLEVVENVHIEVQPNPYNLRYMHTKKARMGHDLYKVE
jgi:3,4-dihydroxy 2-butanone 4-phosphate synthase/GTP cyclohydrolase II